MEAQGIKDGESDSLHDDPIITLNMFITDPKSVRYDERVKAGKATINGVRHLQSHEGDRAGEEDRRVPRAAHGRRHQQGDRQQGHAAAAAGPRTRRPGARRRAALAAPGARGQAPAGPPQGRGNQHGAPIRARWAAATAAKSLQLRRHAESAPGGHDGLDGRDDVDGCPRRAQGGQDHRHHPDRRHGAQRPVARHSASTTTCCAPTATSSRASSATRSARRSSSSCPRAASSRRAATCAARARSACARRRSRRVLTDVAHSLKMHGFQNIIFIGDSGGNQNGPEDASPKR